ncbi:hypothetical protein ANN_15896 [Periplaneta americana]|uniref:Cytochrome-b5 reductase n=1 Tax=Periplaneta americana TaxID=6978 RepID=A0ABQ8SHH8_PERAM|nr:hypothetical protein ANN_15896 [Periplaneta americana]
MNTTKCSTPQPSFMETIRIAFADRQVDNAIQMTPEAATESPSFTAIQNNWGNKHNPFSSVIRQNAECSHAFGACAGLRGEETIDPVRVDRLVVPRGSDAVVWMLRPRRDGAPGDDRTVNHEQLLDYRKIYFANVAKCTFYYEFAGSVYNVTHYMDFHPGGKEELMRGVGKDGTDLFNQIHPWVNYESLLQKCRVGRLVQGRPPPPSFVDRLFPKKSKARLPVLSEVAQGPQKNTRMPSTPSMTMDWFQQMATVTLQFFTKGAVPQTRVMLCSSHRDLIINIKLDKFLHVTHIVLEDNVCWPAKVKINYETGTVEVQFTKEKSVMWKGLGDLQEDNGQVREVQQEPYDSLEVVGMCKVNHNTQLLLLRHKLRVHVTVPIGYSVPVLADINDVEIVRSYTPVAAAMEDKFLPSEWSPDCLCLMVKECPGGQMSPYLCSLKPGDVLKIGQPVGSLRLSAMDGASQLCLLSAGSGFTPMIQIILWALGSGRKKRFFTMMHHVQYLTRSVRNAHPLPYCSRPDCQKVNVLCYNLKERDIMWQEQLEALAGTDSRFSVTHILIEPDSDWRGPTGELTLEILQSIVQKDSFVCVCGPDSFRKAAVRYCNEIETLANILESCQHGELLRNSRRHNIRKLIAQALRKRSFEVHEEVHCVASEGGGITVVTSGEVA